jgi:hypothetical protein
MGLLVKLNAFGLIQMGQVSSTLVNCVMLFAVMAYSLSKYPFSTFRVIFSPLRKGSTRAPSSAGPVKSSTGPTTDVTLFTLPLSQHSWITLTIVVVKAVTVAH